MNSAPVLTVNNLTKTFINGRRFFFFGKNQPSYTAVDNLSFSLYPGEILGLLGPNGAGKTTTIQMLLGTLKPTAGTINYFGKDFLHFRSSILKDVSHASAYNKFPGSLTVQENLDIYGRLYSVSHTDRKSRIDKLLDQFGIEDLRHKQANTLSAGQITRVMLVKAFLPFPKIVLLDEPTASLDPDIARETRQYILKQQNEFGVSIILTSHNMKEVAEVCKRVLVLQKGVIIEEDTPEKLARSVALTDIRLRIENGLDRAIRLVEDNHWTYHVDGSMLTVELDECKISDLLSGFAQLGINYSHIEIQKPSLEDYFLHISKITKRE